jgi:predicted alpha/beta superfamily hydrolase
MAVDRLTLPWVSRVEAPRTVQIPGFAHEHQVRIAVPPAYDATDGVFPTLWVTDNFLEVATSALLGAGLGYAPELIVVAVGAPRDVPIMEFQRRRTFDFTPVLDECTDLVRQTIPDPAAVGGAAPFRDYLIDELRPQLAAEFRMDPHDHGLAGHSGGANFALYSLFTRPDGFAKYLISSPGGEVVDWKERAAGIDDIAARVYLGVGGAELNDPAYMWGDSTTGFSDLVSVTRILKQRDYASLELTTSIVANQDHFSVPPMTFAEGVRALWREQCPRSPRSG